MPIYCGTLIREQAESDADQFKSLYISIFQVMEMIQLTLTFLESDGPASGSVEYVCMKHGFSTEETLTKQ